MNKKGKRIAILALVTILVCASVAAIAAIKGDPNTDIRWEKSPISGDITDGKTFIVRPGDNDGILPKRKYIRLCNKEGVVLQKNQDGEERQHKTFGKYNVHIRTIKNRKIIDVKMETWTNGGYILQIDGDKEYLVDVSPHIDTHCMYSSVEESDGEREKWQLARFLNYPSWYVETVGCETDYLE